MKTNRFLAIVGLLSLALGVFSCKNEPKKGELTGEDITQLEGGITFKFAIPGSEQQSVDTRAALHDNPEWAIDQLWMYEFDKDGKTLMAEPINIRDSKDFKIVNGTEAHYTYRNDWKEDAVRQFYFVVNMPKLDGIQKGASIADFKAKQHAKELKNACKEILYEGDPTLYPNGEAIAVDNDNNFRIPMTGRAMQGGSYNVAVFSNSVISVKLERTVARIDVVNYIPGLEIQKLELGNAFKNSKVIAEDNGPQNGDRCANAVASFATIDNSHQCIGKREDGGAQVKKAFYLYEGKNEGKAKDEVTYVKITAKYGKENRVFHVPFMVERQENKDYKTPKDVLRNHIYRVLIGDPAKPVTEGKITFKIVEEEWNAHNFEEVMPLVRVTGWTLSNEQFNSATLSISKVGTIEQDTGKKIPVKLTLTSRFDEHQEFDTVAKPSVDWIENFKFSQRNKVGHIEFTVKKNQTGKSRSTTLTIKSKQLTDFVYTLTIKQSAE